MTSARSLILICLLALITPCTTKAVQKDKKATLNIVRGEKGSYTFSGSKYSKLTAVQVLKGKREASGITASLARQNRAGRTLTIETTSQAAIGSGYTIQGLTGRKVVAILPVALNITAGESRKATQRRSTKSAANQGSRGGNRNETRNNNKMTDPNQRSPNRKSNGSSEKTNSRTKGSDSRTKTSNKAVAFKISPAGQRSIELNSAAYRSMSEVRVLLRGKPTQTISAKLKKTRQGNSVNVFASKKATRSEYVLQARINNRWKNLPIQMEVDSLPRDARQNSLVEYRPSEVITMPDGTRVVIGGERSGDDPAEFVPTPVVNSWSPTKFGDVGSTLTIQGTNFNDDLVVKIGNTTLDITQRSQTQITAALPDNSASCPPGALRLLRSDGSQIRSCEPHYFVRGDKPFHHIANTTSHNYINSYLMARLSRWVYNDYHSVNNWSAFKTNFENKVVPLGVTAVEFIKPGNGPGDTEVAIVANPAMIVVVFRGSESPTKEENGFKDWFHTNTDLDQKPVGSWQQGAWVHEGFYNAYNDVHSTLKSKLTSLRNNGQPIFLTGHSLGGALSTMAAYRLKQDGIGIQGVYTYGSPRDGNSEWVKAYDNANLFIRTQRWVNRQDFAPRFPPFAKWRHVGQTNNIHMNGSVDLNDNEINAVLAPNPIDHSIDTYCAEILQELSISQKNKVQDASLN